MNYASEERLRTFITHKNFIQEKFVDCIPFKGLLTQGWNKFSFPIKNNVEFSFFFCDILDKVTHFNLFWVKFVFIFNQ